MVCDGVMVCVMVCVMLWDIVCDVVCYIVCDGVAEKLKSHSSSWVLECVQCCRLLITMVAHHDGCSAQ